MPLSPQVAIQRRFNNVWEDDKRQLQMDMFLGLKQKDYYPLTYSLPPGQGIYYKVGEVGFRGVYCKVWEVWRLTLISLTPHTISQKTGGLVLATFARSHPTFHPFIYLSAGGPLSLDGPA